MGISTDGIREGRPRRKPDASLNPTLTFTKSTPGPDSPSRSRSHGRSTKPKPQVEAALDILYENQRGGILCGLLLFSSKALGLADPPPWTNEAHKPSLTDIYTAQPPDPSWTWVWPEWRINHDPEVDNQDDEGWQYASMFWPKVAWHKAHWYNSFVRRRAWIRKRVRVRQERAIDEAHRLGGDYFTIHSERVRSLSPTSQRLHPSQSIARSRPSSSLAHPGVEDEADREIADIAALMAALKAARIDREKTELIENFVANGGDDLFYLGQKMSEIMRHFIFQASRRSLLQHLSAALETSTEKLRKMEEGEQRQGSEGSSIPELELLQKRVSNLLIAVSAADEQVKKLEFWSDIKDIAADGLTKGAVDPDQGWSDGKWAGLDLSMPRDVITEAKVLPDGDEEVLKRHGADSDDEEAGVGRTATAEGAGMKGKEIER
jgi:hypothetical protein